MKGYRLLFLFFLLSLLINTGCSKNRDNDFIQVDDDMIKYEIDNITAYNVDEEGALYVSGLLKNESYTTANDHNEKMPSPYLHKYALDGTLEFSHTFDSSITFIYTLSVKEDVVYFAATGITENGAGIVLYSYNIMTDQLECIYEFDYFESVKQLIYLDERIYIIGYNPYSTFSEKKPSKKSYQSMGEKLVYYSLSDKAVYEIGIKYPITIALNEDTLMINAYMDNEGYCLLSYDPKKDSIKVTTTFNTDKVNYFAVCDNGSKIIYTYNYNSRGLVMSDISSTDQEAELYPDAAVFDNGIYYRKGQVYCMTQSRDIVRISLDPEKMEYPLIRYIASGYMGDGPFGCGYTMIRNELSVDKLAIKVLAQDKDYDLCYLNSGNSTSYNIRKNGVFLPLNKVKGINEYLDACFSYVKDAAINENGDIWMLPIGVDIPGLLVNEEYLAKEHIDFKNNITYEEFFRVYEGLNEDLLKKTSCNSYVIYQNFFAQTFNKQAILNNEEFKSKLKLFQKNNSYPKILNSIDWNDEFLFDYCGQTFNYYMVINMEKDLNSLRMYSMPKLNPTDKNIGTCTFLAVNANSDNKKTVLAYLEDLIAHIMNQETAPLYFQNSAPENDTLRGSMYELYKNGEISFYIDYDVYSQGFSDVVESGADIDEYIKETERKLDIYFNE